MYQISIRFPEPGNRISASAHSDTPRQHLLSTLAQHSRPINLVLVHGHMPPLLPEAQPGAPGPLVQY